MIFEKAGYYISEGWWCYFRLLMMIFESVDDEV